MSPVVDEINNQSFFYADGKEVATSVGELTSVMLYVQKTERNELLLHILYQNNSSDALNVLPDEVRVKYSDSYGNPNEMVVYKADDYIKKLKREQAWQQVALALNAMSQSMNAGTTTTYGTVGGQPVYVETYDPAKQAMVNKQNQDEMQRVATQNQILNSATEQGLVKRNTLLPSYYVEGNVMAKFKNSDRIVVEIPFGPETHTIEFKRPE